MKKIVKKGWHCTTWEDIRDDVQSGGGISLCSKAEYKKCHKGDKLDRHRYCKAITITIEDGHGGEK